MNNEILEFVHSILLSRRDPVYIKTLLADIAKEFFPNEKQDCIVARLLCSLYTDMCMDSRFAYVGNGQWTCFRYAPDSRKDDDSSGVGIDSVKKKPKGLKGKDTEIRPQVAKRLSYEEPDIDIDKE